MILLSSLYFLNLSLYALVVCRSLYVADYAESYREAVAIAHESELELEGVVLTVCVMHEDIFLCDAVLTNLNDLKTEAFLHETVLSVLTENQWLTMFYIDSILCTACTIIYRSVSTVIEDNTVLEYLSHRSALMCISSLQYLDGMLAVCSNSTSEEMTTSTKAKLCWTEWILYSSVRA